MHDLNSDLIDRAILPTRIIAAILQTCNYSLKRKLRQEEAIASKRSVLLNYQ